MPVNSISSAYCFMISFRPARQHPTELPGARVRLVTTAELGKALRWTSYASPCMPPTAPRLRVAKIGTSARPVGRLRLHITSISRTSERRRGCRLCAGFRNAGPRDANHALRRPASEKRQGTKSWWGNVGGAATMGISPWAQASMWRNVAAAWAILSRGMCVN